MERSKIWKGSISFGLLNIPVTLQTARAEKEIHFSMLDKDNFAPIRFRRVNGKTGREVPYRRIVKGYEYDKGEYVIMTPADLKAANPKATQTIDIEDFVLLEDIDPMLFDRPYYLIPQKGGEKGYFLLRDALVKSRKVAIGKIVMRTKQHLVAILVRGEYLVLELLHFAHEVISVDKANYLESIHKPHFNSREVKMAQELIASMTAKWRPEKYRDTYYNDVMKRIQNKVKSGQAHVLEDVKESSEEAAEETKNVVDLLPLLRRSLGARKPAARKMNAQKKAAKSTRSRSS